MLFLILTLIVLGNFLLQSSIFPYINLFNVEPNTALLIIICVALYKGRVYGGIIGIIIGIIQDILFSPVIGINAFIYFFAGYLVGLIEDKLYKENLFIPVVLAIIGTIYFNFSYYVFMFFLSSEIPFLSFVKDKLAIEIILNAIISIPIYKLFSNVFSTATLRFGNK